MKILHAALVIYTKQLTNIPELANLELMLIKKMKLPYARLQVKQLSILPKQTLYAFENVFISALANLVVIVLVDDANSGGGYQRRPLKF